MVNGSRVAIIGAGSVGATVAYALLLRKTCSEILLVDVVEDAVRGQVLDLADSAFLSSTHVRGANFKEAGQCDVVVVTAGAKQRPGESRIELIDRNHKILKSVITEMQPINPNAILLLVANPVDVLTYIAQKLSGLPRKQVFGSGTFLDSSRLRCVLAQELRVSETAVHAYVLGEHGDSQFIAWSSAHVGGIPVLDFPQVQLMSRDAVAKQVSGKALEIIGLKGATAFGIGACVSLLCESIFLNQRHIRPLSVYVEKLGVVLSMPSVLGSQGIEEVFDVPMNDDEREKLAESVKTLKGIMEKYSDI